MDEQKNLMEAKPSLKAEEQEEAYARLAEENKALNTQLSSLRADLERMTEKEQGQRLMEQLVGSRSNPIFEQALQRAQSEDLAPLPIEKRCELGYLLCLGQQAREGRTAGTFGGAYPPPFASSAGNGQVALSAMKAPTSFEMAKENAKKYFRH